MRVSTVEEIAVFLSLACIVSLCLFAEEQSGCINLTKMITDGGEVHLLSGVRLSCVVGCI